MRFHFASLRRAQGASRSLQQALEGIGMEALYTRCQTAVALATGYGSWAELKAVTSAAANPPSPLDHELTIPAVLGERSLQQARAVTAVFGLAAAQAMEVARAAAITGGRGRPRPATDADPCEDADDPAEAMLAPRTMEALFGDLLEDLAAARPEERHGAARAIADRLRQLVEDTGRDGMHGGASRLPAPRQPTPPAPAARPELTVHGSRVRAWIMQWEEADRFMGPRPDGYSVHRSPEAYSRFLKAYWDGMPDEVQDEYERPVSGARLAEVQFDAGSPVAVALGKQESLRVYRHEDVHELVEGAWPTGGGGWYRQR